MQAFVSWSGGKETMLSCYRVMKERNVRIRSLLNMASEDGKHSQSHGVDSVLLRMQAEAIGVPFTQVKSTWNTYEEEFKKAVSELKAKGIDTGIFGDIDLQEHRDWVERVSREVGIKPILPLWNGKREELFQEFIRSGFKAVVVATNAEFLAEDWLGRELNEEFAKDLKNLGTVDLCGEKGEYHTFVYDGPIFKRKIDLLFGEKIQREKHWFLNVTAK